jgi:hypothetical protein
MQTSRLISSISYNSGDFLCGLLNDLVKKGIIDFAHWVKHEPEQDEKKAHYHLILRPSKRMDTNALQAFFLEPIAGDKPLKCLPFTISKNMRDWILYSVHDKGYLITKGESRKFEYSLGDVFSTDEDLLSEHWKEAHRGEDSRMNLFLKMMAEGMDFGEIVKLGVVPLNQYFQYRDIFFNENSRTLKTKRNGRENHELPSPT